MERDPLLLNPVVDATLRVVHRVARGGVAARRRPVKSSVRINVFRQKQRLPSEPDIEHEESNHFQHERLWPDDTTHCPCQWAHRAGPGQGVVEPAGSFSNSGAKAITDHPYNSHQDRSGVPGGGMKLKRSMMFSCKFSMRQGFT